MKLITAAFITIIILIGFLYFTNATSFFNTKTSFSKTLTSKNIPIAEKVSIKKYGDEIKTYVNKNNFCEKYCFFINMKLPSGKKRFFIYDLKNDSIAGAGLVTHGGGSETGTDKLQFSNVPSSGATSLGKYKIGNEYSGKFGMAFKLYGLEPSNSRAFERFVVLHAHSCVPNKEIAPLPLCTSLGCPTVSPQFLTELKKYINSSDKPVVLSIYY
jgi:hypothetical protein